MRKHAKINRNKQLQKNKKKKIEQEIQLYKKTDAYRVITTIHLSKDALLFDLDLGYNYMNYTTEEMNDLEKSYLARCSDILLLTVTSSDIQAKDISLVKMFMPTTIIVYERKNKNIAKSVSKMFGDVKICEISMLNKYLQNIKSETSKLCSSRPYMLAKNAEYDGRTLSIEGFLKHGFKSDKVSINGFHIGAIEEIHVGDTEVDPRTLNGPENISLLRPNEVDNEPTKNEDLELGNESGSSGIDEEEPENIYEETEYSIDLPPEYDLIEKYKEYRGIINPAKCRFRGQAKPEYYKDLIFMKNNKYAKTSILSRKSIIPKNTYVRMKIHVEGLQYNSFIIVFGLFEFENHNTIWNYEFSSDLQIKNEITVDLGHRIISSRCILSRNLNNNIFRQESDLKKGIVSFIGPYSPIGDSAHILFDDTSRIKIFNGLSNDRLFFDSVVLEGKPRKIFKKYVIICGMFYNKEQVEYFSNIRLMTRGDNVGYIKKAQGLKGAFKAYFHQPIHHGDTVSMTLYKRVFL